MPRNRLPPWHEEFVLPNRRAILIRPIRPEDAAPLQGVFGMLAPVEVRAGFSADVDVLDEATAQRLSRPDPKTELVLVGAEPLAPGEAMIAGLARARIVPGTRQAEYAILLGNYVAGLGLGRHLMQKLVKWSRGRYRDRLYGDTPGSNEPMLELAASMGFRPSDEAGVPPGLIRLVREL
ncbi:GNAT family N-acetyltransferase [Pseudoxanthomonas koreensis]|uniref:GNAT family N-acetyltransferase n=1 Tax=Pseudoxanthomonas koreensis TaxID=266061 RepID=UPI001391C966|nr:GNAT family N-acetyltransferase [Pseudoxanthomonas koreensis]KAF1691470.1 N-acetyltransferase [Pseudoxanthomonas koreensis]